MSDLLGNHIVGFLMAWLMSDDQTEKIADFSIILVQRFKLCHKISQELHYLNACVVYYTSFMDYKTLFFLRF